MELTILLQSAEVQNKGWRYSPFTSLNYNKALLCKYTHPVAAHDSSQIDRLVISNIYPRERFRDVGFQKQLCPGLTFQAPNLDRLKVYNP